MAELHWFLIAVLMVNILVGLTRVLRGPTPADRMLAAEMFSTSAVVIVLLLAVAGGRDALLDVALVFALLSALAVVTFVHRAWTALVSTTAATDKGGGGEQS